MNGENKYGCADCGARYPSGDAPCRRCGSFRVVLVSLVEHEFGWTWDQLWEEQPAPPEYSANDPSRRDAWKYGFATTEYRNHVAVEYTGPDGNPDVLAVETPDAAERFATSGERFPVYVRAHDLRSEAEALHLARTMLFDLSACPRKEMVRTEPFAKSLDALQPRWDLPRWDL